MSHKDIFAIYFEKLRHEGKIVINVKQMLQSQYFRHVSTLITGSLVSQVIPILASPFVARLYSPNDYAVLAAYSAITTLFTMAATGSFDMALMLDKNDQEAMNTGVVAIAITSFITLLAMIGMIMFRKPVAGLTGNENVIFWLYFVPLTVFFTGATQTLAVWNNRKQRYKRLASNKLILTFFSTGLTLSLGLAGLREKGLLISTISGQIIAFGILFAQTVSNDKEFLYEISIERLKQSFIKHMDFPKYNMPQAFFDGIRESAMLLIISNFFGAYALGSFSFARNVLMAPLQIIGGAVGQVYYERASSDYNKKRNLLDITKTTYLALVGISLPFFIIILFFGENIFSFIFSSKWTQAGMISQILAIWLFLRFITSPISTIPLILNHQKTNFQISVIFNLVPIITLFLSSLYFRNFDTALISFVFAYSLLLIFVQCWYYMLSRARY